MHSALSLLTKLLFVGSTLVSGVVGEPTKTPRRASPPPSQCEVLQLWAQENHAIVPTDLAGMAALPLPHRRAAYSQLSTNQKVALWREQFVLLSASPSLNSGQKSFLAAAGRHLEKLMDLEKGRTLRDSLLVEAKQLFTRDEARQYLATLKPADASTVLATRTVHFPVRDHALSVSLRLTNATSPARDCSCSAIITATGALMAALIRPVAAVSNLGAAPCGSTRAQVAVRQ